MQAVLQTGMELRADIVLIQEPPYTDKAQFRQRHPGFRIEWAAKTATAIRVDTRWKVHVHLDLSTHTEGYVQVMDCSRKSRNLRAANVYDQVQTDTRRRPAREADWSKIVTDETLLAGDFNAHSHRWNTQCIHERDATWIKHLMESNDLSYLGDGVNTCITPNSNTYCVIDLTFGTEKVARQVRADTLVQDKHATGSDHRIIRWRMEGQQTTEETVIRGWSIKEMCKPLSQAEQNEGKENGEMQAARDWRKRVERRPVLDDACVSTDIDEEARFIRTQLHTILNTYAKPIRITARSKRWWSDKIKQRRQALGKAIHRYRGHTGTHEQIRIARRELAREIRTAKRECWENFLQHAQGHEVWDIVQYTRPPRSESTMGTICDEHGRVAATPAEKQAMMAAVSCPPQNEWRGVRTEATEQNEWEEVTQLDVEQALFSQDSDKVPGSD